MKRGTTEERKREERAKSHNCDGQCYMDDRICPSVDYCPETRKSEGLAFVIVIAASILGLLTIAIFSVYALLKVLM